jgi:hypothetical protein
MHHDRVGRPRRLDLLSSGGRLDQWIVEASNTNEATIQGFAEHMICSRLSGDVTIAAIDLSPEGCSAE